jgi:ketosteroid isomerase-like protein
MAAETSVSWRDTLTEMERFPKPSADNSGTAVADIQWLADREAIRNTIATYGHLFDEEHIDMFLDLYTSDVILQSSIPCFGNSEWFGKETLKEYNYATKGAARSGVQYRHTMAMIHVMDQTKDSAVVRAQPILGSTIRDGRTPTKVGRATYTFWMTKIGDSWKIKKQYIEMDGPIPGAAFHPKSKNVKFTPDNRPICK